MFASETQVHLWVMLEANPGVTNYCERPALSVEQAAESVADFWVIRDGVDQWLTVEDNVDEARVPDPHRASQTTQDSPCVETIFRKDIERHRVWIQNWMSLLPYLATGSHLIDPTMLMSMIQFFDRLATIDEAEQHFSRIDPVLVRTSIIAGLHGGQLISPDLTALAFGRHTRVSRYCRGAPHETQ
jgi:hypothetical protein